MLERNDVRIAGKVVPDVEMRLDSFERIDASLIDRSVLVCVTHSVQYRLRRPVMVCRHRLGVVGVPARLHVADFEEDVLDVRVGAHRLQIRQRERAERRLELIRRRIEQQVVGMIERRCRSLPEVKKTVVVGVLHRRAEDDGAPREAIEGGRARDGSHGGCRVLTGQRILQRSRHAHGERHVVPCGSPGRRRRGALEWIVHDELSIEQQPL